MIPLGNPNALSKVRGRSLVVDLAATRPRCSISFVVPYHLYNWQDHSSYVSHLGHSCNRLGRIATNKAVASPDKIASKYCYNLVIQLQE